MSTPFFIILFFIGAKEVGILLDLFLINERISYKSIEESLSMITYCEAFDLRLKRLLFLFLEVAILDVNMCL